MPATSPPVSSPRTARASSIARNQAADEVFELFSAPVEGGPPVRLNDPLPPGGGVGSSPRAAGGRAVYLADQSFDGVFELFSVPADGSAGPVRLNGGLVADGDVTQFWVGGGGQFVVYLADELVNNTLQLFRVPSDGSAPPVNLIPGHAISGFWLGPRAWLNPDGSAALFTTNDCCSETLHGVPTDGSAAPVELDVLDVSCFCVVSFEQVTFSSDGSRIVYAAVVDHDGPIVVDLHSVPVDGSQAPVQLNLQALDGYFLSFVYDGQDHVAYRDDALDLYSVRTDGTQRVQLNPPGWPLAPQGFLGGALMDSDPGNVVFRAESGDQTAVFRAPPDGNQSVVALVPPAAGQSVCQIQILGPDVFISGEVNSVFGLVAITLPDGDVTVLSGLQGCGFFSTPVGALTPDGQELVFHQPRDVAGMLELHLVPVDGSLPPRQLNAPLVAAGDVSEFLLTPDGERAIYRADQDLDETVELFGVRLDSAVPPVKYNLPMPGGPVLGDVLAFRTSPDGSRVAYLADENVDERFDLYTVRTDGRGAPRRLTETLSGSGDVLADFAFTPSGQRLVFQREVVAGTFRLYSVPVNLGQPPEELDSSGFAFPPPFAVSPDGARVVYLKATTSTDRLLRSAAIDGSAPPVTLADPPGAVQEYELAASGDTVVYRADQDTVGVFEPFPSRSTAARRR